MLLSIVVMGIINGGQYLGTMDHTGGNVRGKTQYIITYHRKAIQVTYLKRDEGREKERGR